MRVVTPEIFHPQLQFRYSLFTTKLLGATVFARSAQQPSFDNNPIKVDYGNSSFNIKGKTSWEPISIRCYQFEGITTLNFWKYLQEHQVVRYAKDNYAALYKHDLRLVSLTPMGLPIGTWKLVGAFYQSVRFGDMDWGTDDVVEIDLSIVYDYAEFNPIL